MNENTPSMEDQARHYDQWWTEEFEIGKLNGYELLRLSEIFRAMAFLDFEFGIKRGDLEICDLGCGRGWLSELLSASGKVTGVDLSAKGVEKASKLWPHIDFRQADILSYTADRKFDLIVSTEVIEHVTDQRQFAATVARNLKPGGFVILTCPNARAKPVWVRDGQVTQPIEDWPSFRELKTLFSGEFEILIHKTFAFDFSYLGIYRVLSAPKLLRLLRRTGLLRFYDAFREAAGIGLHQILVARRR
jgi:2-polyprenyl-3-methyl-5-hydroxy-6-metoxy-1,4-benzoquinol methylase